MCVCEAAMRGTDSDRCEAAMRGTDTDRCEAAMRGTDTDSNYFKQYSPD